MKRFLGQKQLFALLIFIGETVIPVVVGEPISVSTLAIKTGLFLWELRKPHPPAAKAELPPPPSPASATVTETIAPHTVGRVSVFGTEWNARCQQPIVLSPGTIVDIVGLLDPVTLLVQVGDNTPPPIAPPCPSHRRPI